MNKPYNYGYEHSNYFTCDEVSSSFNHIQLSVPGKIRFEDALSLSTHSYKDIIIHSNELNSIGKNDWNHLEKISKKYNVIKPALIVEHLTTFVSEDGGKIGIKSISGSQINNTKDLLFENVNKYMSLIDAKLSLENTPITKDVYSYFRVLSEAADKFELGITIDMAHLILSALSTENPLSFLDHVSKLIDPIQIHVSNIKVNNGILYDSHSGISLELAALGKNMFPNVKYITIEQSAKHRADAVNKFLKDVRACNPSSKVPFLNSKASPYDLLEANNYLLNNSLGFPGVRPINQRSNIVNETALDRYEDKHLFSYPFESIFKSSIKRKEHLKYFTATVRLASIYNSWFRKESNIRFLYGKDKEYFAFDIDHGKNIYQKKININKYVNLHNYKEIPFKNMFYLVQPESQDA